MVSAFSGGAAHTDLQRSAARVQFTLGGRPLQRDFARRVSPSTSPAFALAAGYWPASWWGFRAQAGLAPSRFEITVADREKAELPTDSAVVGTARYSALRIWSYDLNLLFRAPFTPRGRVAPYGLVGAGIVRYQAAGDEQVPPEAQAAFAAGRQPTRVSAVIGGGALVPLQRRNLALTFELTDHLAKTPVPVAAGSTLYDSGVTLTLDEKREPAGAGKVRVTNHIRLLIGVSWFAR